MTDKFDLSIDHAMMIGAKTAFDTCLRAAVAKAIATGSDEGSASLKIKFTIFTATDRETGELTRAPVMEYAAGFSVPMKEGIKATIAEKSRLEMVGQDWKLINGQISMAEIMKDAEAERAQIDGGRHE